MTTQKRHQIIHGIDAVQRTRMNQTHEQIAHFGAMQGLVEQSILPVQHHALKRPFTEVASAGRMIQITPQMRVLVASEPVDFPKYVSFMVMWSH